MTELLEKLAVREGVHPSPYLGGVTVGRCNQNRTKGPVLYEPSIVFVFQGRKRAYLGHHTYYFDPPHSLVLTLPLPFEGETVAI
ncbi:MAG: AraC family transcriptional regulator [Terriglobales bacterium]